MILTLADVVTLTEGSRLVVDFGVLLLLFGGVVTGVAMAIRLSIRFSRVEDAIGRIDKAVTGLVTKIEEHNIAIPRLVDDVASGKKRLDDCDDARGRMQRSVDWLRAKVEVLLDRAGLTSHPHKVLDEKEKE